MNEQQTNQNGQYQHQQPYPNQHGPYREDSPYGNYAGFWIRFGAYFLDGLILFIPAMVINFLLFMLMVGSQMTFIDYTLSDELFWGYEGVVMLVNMVLYLSYFGFMHSSKHQATLGKMICGIKVIRKRDGERLTLGHAIGRYFALILNGFTLYIGFMMAGWTEKKQGLHDMISGTLVVHKK